MRLEQINENILIKCPLNHREDIVYKRYPLKRGSTQKKYHHKLDLFLKVNLGLSKFSWGCVCVYLCAWMYVCFITFDSPFLEI